MLFDDISNYAVLPFSIEHAHELYEVLLGPVEELVKDKHLLIVPSGTLAQLPFHVLVTQKPSGPVTGYETYRQTVWLTRTNAITVLPSVSSLKVLRQQGSVSHAKRLLLGVGNPLLDGADHRYNARAALARRYEQCSKITRETIARPTGEIIGPRTVRQRAGLFDVADIRMQEPLPETADELCRVASSFGVRDSDILLGARATERAIKLLSNQGILAEYRIVHFATHGVLPGELTVGTEPGLILTPPSKATAEDDGYLTASEIAGLKLNADWVILSACNTAGGGSEKAEALSGLARAFFYAGSRALLVSHWAVYSDTAVKLITMALSTIATDKMVGKSEALRRSMLAVIENGLPHEAHPAFWAPFVVVGEGRVETIKAGSPSAPERFSTDRTE